MSIKDLTWPCWAHLYANGTGQLHRIEDDVEDGLQVNKDSAVGV